jgi:Asp-tRNA(Asn)/Glu-tRNA(Gln) amidotransferase A subunit family amidase
MADDICFTPGDRLAEQIRSGELSPVDVVDSFLERIRSRNGELNAFITVNDENARSTAREAERAVNEGKDLGPLHGVPVAVKDNFDVAGLPTTYGSRLFEDNVARENDLLVERILDAGGIVIGKTNLPQFARSGTTDNELRDPTPTPFDTSRTAGGSSGGSAAAAAAGMAPFTIGSDAGGSIRIPASFCGVFGLKPSFGRVPLRKRPVGFLHSTPMSAVGPITRTVGEAALLMDVLAGPDSRDPHSLPDDDVEYAAATERSVDDLSAAFCPTLDVFPVSASVAAVVEDAVVDFDDAVGGGVEYHPIDLHCGHESLLDTMYETWTPVSYAMHNRTTRKQFGIDLYGDHRDALTEYSLDSIERSHELSALDYVSSDTVRTAVYDGIVEVLKEYDLVLSPTVAVSPFSKYADSPSDIDGDAVPPNGWHLTLPYNFSGHPAASVPAGVTSDGLPVGLQVAGRRFADDDVIAACRAYERHRPWQDSYPDQ